MGHYAMACTECLTIIKMLPSVTSFVTPETMASELKAKSDLSNGILRTNMPRSLLVEIKRLVNITEILRMKSAESFQFQKHWCVPSEGTQNSAEEKHSRSLYCAFS